MKRRVKRSDAAALVARLVVVFRPFGWCDASAEVYVEHLVDLDVDRLAKAVFHWIGNESKMPMIADLRRSAGETRRRYPLFKPATTDELRMSSQPRELKGLLAAIGNGTPRDSDEESDQ